MLTVKRRMAGALNLLRSRSPVKQVLPYILALVLLVCTTGRSSVAFAGTDSGGEAESLQIFVDMRPGICPNHLRIESPLTIPIAVLGTMDFEVAWLDPGSVRLSREGTTGEVKPVSWTYKDVGTAAVGGVCACHKLRGDGLDDLEFYFESQDVVEALELGGLSEELVPVIITGSLMTGEAVEGIDCAMVISGIWREEDFGDEIGLLPHIGDELSMGDFKFGYYTTVSDRVTFTIHDVHGSMVAELANMDMAPGIYSAIWDGKGRDRQKAPPGIYFARVCTSMASDILKITVTQ
jgi:hypothetical protein